MSGVNGQTAAGGYGGPGGSLTNLGSPGPVGVAGQLGSATGYAPQGALPQFPMTGQSAASNYNGGGGNISNLGPGGNFGPPGQMGGMGQNPSPGFGQRPMYPGLQNGNVQQGAPMFPRQGGNGPMPPVGQPISDPMSAGGNFAPQGHWQHYLQGLRR